MLLGSSLLYLLHHRNLGTHENADRAVVHGVDHVVEQLDGLQLEDEQRVFLLVRCILYRVLQLVEFAQVLFPSLVNDVKQNLFLKLLDHRLTFGVVGFLEVTGNVIHLAAVSQGHNDALVHLSLSLVNLLDDRHGDFLNVLHMALETAHGNLEHLLAQFFATLVDKLVVREGTFHCEDLDELFLATLVVILFNDVDHTVPDCIRDVHADALAHQGVTTLRVDHSTLLVHDIIVLQQSLTDAEVVLLDLLLGTLYLFANHGALQHFAFLEAQLVHYGSNALRAEQTHELVLK